VARHTSNIPQNDLLFPSLYSLSLSWNFKIQKSLNMINISNVFETIQEFIYICF